MIKKFNEYNEAFDSHFLDSESDLASKVSKEDASELLFAYYNKCMDEFNGSVSEECIYMLLDDMYIAEDEIDIDNQINHENNKL